MSNLAEDSVSVSSMVEGATFVLELLATRTTHGLRIERMELCIKCDEVEAQAGYIFDADIEPEGVEQAISLSEAGARDGDGVFLRRLLELTDRYSCGEWRSIETQRSSTQLAVSRACMRFEEYAADPFVVARRFESRYLEDDLLLVATFEVAAWGEFVAVRVSDPSGRFVPGIPKFEVLLSASNSRTCEQAYRELLGVISQLADAFATDGYAGMVVEVAALSLEIVLPASLSAEDNPSGSLGGVRTIPRRKIQKLTSGTEISLVIERNRAELIVWSTHDSQQSGLRIQVGAGGLFPEFTAAQIRAIQRLYDAIGPRSQVVGAETTHDLLARLSLKTQPSTDQTAQSHPVYLLAPETVPGVLSVSSLTVEPRLTMPELRYFISAEESALVLAEDAIQIEERFAITPQVIGELRKGGRMVVLRLRHEIALRRPDLASFMIVTRYPGGSQTVRVVSGMGGNRLFDVPERITDSSRSYISVGSVCRLFSQQERGGWIPVIRALGALGDERVDPDRGIQLPRLEDPVAIESFAAAARALRFLMRSGDGDFWGFCSSNKDGSAALSIGRTHVAGALEVQFRCTEIIEIAVRVRTDDATSRWSDWARFRHSGFVFAGESVFKIVTIMRRFFRHQARIEAAEPEIKAQIASAELAQSLQSNSFSCM